MEQKNWTVVRQTIGYRRYESKAALNTLTIIYADLRLFVNFFQPVLKLKKKERQGSKVRKQYDQAQTPHQRAMASSDITAKDKLRLQHTYLQLNPVMLRNRIDDNLKQLWRLSR